MLLIDGGVGEGKTTLAVQIADYIQGEPIIFEEQLATGGDEFIEKLLLCKKNKHKVIIYDEAGDYTGRGAMTKFNQRLNRVFDVYRAFKVFVVLALPNVRALDRNLFDKKIPRMLINCYSRSKKKGRYRVYDIKRVAYLKYYGNKLVNPPEMYNKVFPNFRGYFYDLEPKRSKALNKYSITNKEDIVHTKVDLEKKGLITFKEIASQLSRSVDWVQRKIKKKKIKHKESYKRTKYFHNSVVETLRLELK